MQGLRDAGGIETEWFPSEGEALKLLKKERVPKNVVAHIEAVAAFAVGLGNRARAHSHAVDIELIKIGALLHDIGRSVTHGVGHGCKGREILRGHGVDERLCRIACNHVGAGILADEAVELGLPKEDMVPETLEEKIVCYADKLAFGDRIGSEDEVLRQFAADLGASHPAVNRLRRLFAEMREVV